MLAHRTRVAALARRHRLPMITALVQFAGAGGLPSYAFELVVNARAARQIALAIPPSIAARADRTIG